MNSISDKLMTLVCLSVVSVGCETTKVVAEKPKCVQIMEAMLEVEEALWENFIANECTVKDDEEYNRDYEY